MGLVVVSPMASVDTLLKSPQVRQQIASLASSFSWNAEAVALNTIGGYTTWKIGTFIFLIAVWPLLAASRTLRGEEEQGTLDGLLSLPQSRLRVALEKLVAMWTALLAMGLLVGLVAFAGGRTFGGGFGLEDGLLFGVNLALICAVIGGLALMLSQFTQERSWTGGLLLIFIVLDMVHRIFPGTSWISKLSPIYYYNLSKPLIPSYGASAGAMLLLLAMATILSGAAVRLLVRRDVGGTVPLPGRLRLLAHRDSAMRSLPVWDRSLRTVFTRSLRTIVWPTAWWRLGIAGFASWTVIVVGQMESQLTKLLSESSSAQTLIENLGGSGASLTAGFLSAIFVLLPLFLMAFAVTQVNRWSADEQEGRLDLLLATPKSRLQVLLAHFAALGSAIVFIGLSTLFVTAAAAAVTGLTLDPGNLAAATLGMIPLALLIAAIGYLGAGWLRTAADTGLLSFLLLIWFFISFIGPELNWPNATLRLSAFYYYGTPLLHGLQTASIVGVVAASAIALGLGAVRFNHKDIGT
jgi:ABC-2 type transport system permease protein